MWTVILCMCPQTTIELPLLTTYQPGNKYACLRLDATQTNGWSAYAPATSGVTIASVSVRARPATKITAS